jgi:hypothetical protein
VDVSIFDEVLRDALLDDPLFQEGGTVHVKLHTADPGQDYEVLEEGTVPGGGGRAYTLYRVRRPQTGWSSRPRQPLLPAPEPLPDPLRWTCIRLDQEDARA